MIRRRTEDDLPIGAEASNQNAVNDRRNAPPHVPEALQNPEEIRVNFEPPTPGRSVAFHSAVDDDNHPMETSHLPDDQDRDRPHGDAAGVGGAAGGEGIWRDALSYGVAEELQRSADAGNPTAHAFLQLSHHLMGEIHNLRGIMSRDAQANTRYRLRSTSQQRDDNARQLQENLRLDAIVQQRTEVVLEEIGQRKKREEEQQRRGGGAERKGS